jgi:hypothetical protein
VIFESGCPVTAKNGHTHSLLTLLSNISEHNERLVVVTQYGVLQAPDSFSENLRLSMGQLTHARPGFELIDPDRRSYFELRPRSPDIA